ncbi:MAG: peptidoglycan-binding protein, partial [Candidatus Pacebacteria bacterium]|nr:peptidoglycan-binding protein [Candidatus Paceibacterota bacterium]
VTDSMSNVSAVLALSSFSVNARGSVSVVFLQQISDQSRKQNTEQGCTSNTPYSPLTGFRCMGVPPVISKTDTIVSTPNIEIQVYKKETKLFPRDLKLGMTGEDIRELQKYLNKNGFIVAKSGIGSIGKENTRFGPATEAAVIKFQKANKLPGTGFFGPKSRGVVEN